VIAKAWRILRADGAFALAGRMRRSVVHRLTHRDEVPPRRAYTRAQIESTRRALRASPRVLLATHDLSLSGAPMMLFVLARALRARGYAVTVGSLADGPLRAVFEAAGFDLLVRPELMTEDGIAELGERAGIVVANTIHAWYLVHCARSLLRPCVFWIHESAYGERLAGRRKVVAQALRVADAVVFPAAATAARYRRFEARHNFSIANYGIDVPALVGEVSPNPRDAGSLRIVHIGSIEPRKGQDILLKAVAALPAEVASKIQVEIIGRALDRRYFAKVSAIAARQSNVVFAGETSHDVTLSRLRDADVLALASRDEVLPVTILEAMALGKPVIATRAGGVGEMIEDGVSGLLADVNDHRQMARAITRLFYDRVLLASMGDAARRRYDAGFTFEHFANRMTALIGDVVDRYEPY
jgi:glycosyltransferase involved in cell wall biosynthesis